MKPIKPHVLQARSTLTARIKHHREQTEFHYRQWKLSSSPRDLARCMARHEGHFCEASRYAKKLARFDRQFHISFERALITNTQPAKNV